MTKYLFILGSVVCIVAAPRTSQAQEQPSQGTVTVSFSVLPVNQPFQDGIVHSGMESEIDARSSSMLSQFDSPRAHDDLVKVTYGVAGNPGSTESVSAHQVADRTIWVGSRRVLTEMRMKKPASPDSFSDANDRLVVMTITD